MEADAVVRLEIGPEVRLDVKDLVQHLRHELGETLPQPKSEGTKPPATSPRSGVEGWPGSSHEPPPWSRRELAVVAAVPVPDHHARIGVLLKRSNDVLHCSRRR